MSEQESIDAMDTSPDASSTKVSEEYRDVTVDSAAPSSSTGTSIKAKRRGMVRFVFALALCLCQIAVGLGVWQKASQDDGISETAAQATINLFGDRLDWQAVIEVSLIVVKASIFSIAAIMLAIWIWRLRRRLALGVFVLAMIGIGITGLQFFQHLMAYDPIAVKKAKEERQAHLVSTTFNILREMVMEYHTELTTLQNEYEASHFNLSLNATKHDVTSDPAQIKEFRIRLMQALKDLDLSAQEVPPARSRMLQRVSAADFDKSQRAQAQKLAEQFIVERGRLQAEWSECQQALIKVALNILDHMENCHERVLYSDEILYFYNDDDFHLYKAQSALLGGLNHELSVDRMRSFAVPLSFVVNPDPNKLPDHLPMAPVPASKEFQVSIDGQRVVINGQPIVLPTTLEAIEAVLGKGYRASESKPGIWVWDALGISCSSTPHAEGIDSLVFHLRPHENAGVPWDLFVGSVTLFDRPYTRFDAPFMFNEPFNQSMQDWFFQPLDDGLTWQSPDNPLVTRVLINNKGLTATITVSLPMPDLHP